jgi:hypothetical protein
MIRCTAALCGQAVIRDSITNFVSVINIFESIEVPQLPSMMAAISALFTLQRDHEDNQDRPAAFVRLTLIGQPPQNLPVNVDFQGHPGSRCIVQMAGIPLGGPGVMRVALFIEDREVGGWNMPVLQVGPVIQPAPALAGPNA